MKIFFILVTLIFQEGGASPDTTSDISMKTESAVTFDYTKQDEDFWKKHLKGETLNVCRYHGTEHSHTGQYDHFWEDGTYYCACCGGDHAVYNSTDKFNSGTGWPSFYKPIEGGVIERLDPSDEKAFLGLRNLILEKRTEVICSRCHSHLGHVFNDVDPKKGRRYCMNSAALTFVKEGESPKRTYTVEE